MAEEVKNENNEPVNNPESNEQPNSSGGDFKEYYDNMIQKSKDIKEKDIEKQLNSIADERKDWDDGDQRRRFGYFSVPYPATVGDQAYSQNHNYPKVVDGKIQLEKRGIYTCNPKTGKGHDALFPPPEIPEEIKEEFEERQKQIDQQGKKDREEYLKKLKEKREKKELFHFKPTGPQIMFDFYKEINEGDNEKMLKFTVPEAKEPLYKEPDKKRFILPEHKVKTENRQIYTGITKVGKSFKPTDYFEFYMSDDNVQQRIIEGDKKDKEDKLNKVKERKQNIAGKAAFKPAALKKCEPFSNIIETYGVYASDDDKKAAVKKAVEDKKKGVPKYAKQLPKGSIVHDKPFSPPRLIYQGRDGLFNDDLYKIPEPTEKDKKVVVSVRERKAAEEESNKNKRMPFTYNKLMKSSTFAPPISSFMTNLRREFPSIKFH